MSEKNDNVYMGAAAIGSFLVTLWPVAFLIHLGPEPGPGSPWWTLPYYFTAVGVGFVLFTIVGALILLGIEKAMGES